MRLLVLMLLIAIAIPTAMAKADKMPHQTPHENVGEVHEHGFGEMHGFKEHEHGFKGVKEERMEKMRRMIEERKKLIGRERSLTKDFKDEVKNYKKFKQLALKLGLRSKEGFKYAKLYVVHGLLSAVDFLNIVKVNVISLNISNDTKEKILSEIDEMIDNLQKKIEKVNNTTSPEELRKEVKEVREYWISVKPKIRIYGELFVVSKFYYIAERAEMIGMNVQANATEKVKDLLKLYFEHVDRAKELLEEAKDKIVKGEDAMEEIREARKELIQAFVTLREIYKSLGREKLKGLSLGNETGQMWAEIEGNLSVSGRVVVVLKGEGKVDVNEKSIVTVVGFEKVGESNGTVTYEGKGSIVAKGDVNVSARGEFKMFVKGRGVVYLEGKGEYVIKPLPEEEIVHSELRGNETLMIGELQ